MFKRLARKWAIPGWIVLAFWLAIEVLDWWHRIEFVRAKVIQMNPSLHPVFEWIISGQGRLCIMLVGFVLLLLAAWRKERNEAPKATPPIAPPASVPTALAPTMLPEMNLADPFYDQFWQKSKNKDRTGERVIKGRAEAGDPIVSVADRSFEPRQTTPEGQPPFFKRKIRIVLRNETGKEIEVDTPDWATDAGDLAIQPHGHGLGAASKIRLENKQSGGWKEDKWLEEADQLIVPPAHHFEAWVGLNHQYTDNTLQRHVREGRIGTLVFSVLIEGQKREVRIRVR
jgi:hypothetical protein